MKLWFSPTSPYVRKVSVCAHELGLWQQLELVTTNPWDATTDLGALNPLHKVPTLLLDDGAVLYDSPVICEYLDALHTPRLFPFGHARWQALRGQALADGLLDAAVNLFIETRKRAENERSLWWLESQQASVERALDALNIDAESYSGEPDIAQIAGACALGYLDFRFAGNDWRSRRPTLARWFEVFAARPSMQATQPRDPV